MENKFILNYTIKGSIELGIYDLNNLELLFKFKLYFICNIYPLNKKNFITFRREGDKAKFNIYNANIMKSIQNFEIKANTTSINYYLLFPINEKEFVFNDTIIKIDEQN